MDNGGEQARLIVYGHPFCGLARRLAEVLAEHCIDHEWRDVQTGEPRFRDELRQLARGYLSVPTVVFPDGTVLVEPRPKDVLERLRPAAPNGAAQMIRQLFSFASPSLKPRWLSSALAARIVGAWTALLTR